MLAPHLRTNSRIRKAPPSGVARAIVQQKTRVIDIDLRSYFDNVRHDRLLAKVGQRVVDADVMHLPKVMLKASATG